MSRKTVSGIMLTLLLTSALTLALNIEPVKASPEMPFFDDFNDGVADGWTQWLGTWYVDNKEYVASPFGGNATSTVDGLNLTECVIETRLRFQDTEVLYTAGIVFRYTQWPRSYYSFDLGKGYNKAWLIYHDSEQGGGTGWNYLASFNYPVESNVNYTLKVGVDKNTFKCYVDGVEILTVSDEHLMVGGVGLNLHSPSPAVAFFDDFKVAYWNPADINRDLKVDGKDIAIAAWSFGSYPTHPRWNPYADINQDNKVDGKDLTRIAKDFGKRYP